jgi:predicted RNase H-like HicB family nuclease
MTAYIALVYPGKGGEFFIEFPDLPGCLAIASNFAEAEFVAQKALREHLEERLSSGEPLPSARSLEQLEAEGIEREALPLLVFGRGGPVHEEAS